MSADQHVPMDVKIANLAQEVLMRDELFIVAVVVRGSKGSRLVEVYVDGDDGVSVSELAKISRELAFALDAEDVVKGKYLLNVSTPGEERCLLFERQYQRHVGKQLEGENLGVTDGVLKLKISDSESTKDVPLDRISKAKIKLPW
jgi:ribosome maturation factor RimP